MSTILKALRRLEQEKSAASDRPLSETVVNAPEPPPKPKSSAPRLVVTLAATAVLFAAGAAAWWVLGREPLQQEAAPTQLAAVPTEIRPAPPKNTGPPSRRRAAPQPSAADDPVYAFAREQGVDVPAVPGASDGHAAPGGAPGHRPAPQPPIRELPAAALTSDVAVVERVPVHEPPAEAEPEPPLLKLGPVSPPKPRARPKPGSQRPGASALAPTRERPQAVAAVPKRPPAARPATPATAPETPPSRAAGPPSRPAAKPKPTPAVAAAPAPKTSRSPLPGLLVERTHWHPRAEERVAFVVLADRGETMELHEGDAVGPLVVKTIEPSGVSFLHDGAVLRRRVGAR